MEHAHGDVVLRFKHMYYVYVLGVSGDTISCVTMRESMFLRDNLLVDKRVLPIQNGKLYIILYLFVASVMAMVFCNVDKSLKTCVWVSGNDLSITGATN